MRRAEAWGGRLRPLLAAPHESLLRPRGLSSLTPVLREPQPRGAGGLEFLVGCLLPTTVKVSLLLTELPGPEGTGAEQDPGDSGWGLTCLCRERWPECVLTPEKAQEVHPIWSPGSGEALVATWMLGRDVVGNVGPGAGSGRSPDSDASGGAQAIEAPVHGSQLSGHFASPAPGAQSRRSKTVTAPEGGPLMAPHSPLFPVGSVGAGPTLWARRPEPPCPPKAAGRAWGSTQDSVRWAELPSAPPGGFEV